MKQVVVDVSDVGKVKGGAAVFVAGCCGSCLGSAGWNGPSWKKMPWLKVLGTVNFVLHLH